MLESIESVFYSVIHWGILFFEVAGVAILLATGVKCAFRLIISRSQIRLTLAKGIALALEFKLGGEVLRTVIVHDWSELAILGAIIVLRSAITYLIHWEIQHIEPEED